MVIKRGISALTFRRLADHSCGTAPDLHRTFLTDPNFQNLGCVFLLSILLVDIFIFIITSRLLVCQKIILTSSKDFTIIISDKLKKLCDLRPVNMLTKQTIPRVELEKIIAEFDLGQIEKFEPLETSGNIAYCLTINGKAYFLRLCPRGQRWRSQEEIEAEIELLEYLKSNDFPIIAALKNRDGEAVISWKNHHGYLREFIKAEAKINPNFAEVKKFGKLVGWLHSLTKNYKTKNYREHIFNLSKTKKHFYENKPKILASNFQEKQKFVRQFEKEILSLNFSDNLPCGMIHEDLGKRHILWQEDRIAALVDFDRSYFGRLILDLGQAVRGWCFVDNWISWNNEVFEALIEGYQQKRNLTELEKESLINAIKFGILERSLSFCLNFIEITHHKDDQNFALDGIFRQLGLIEDNRKKLEKILIKKCHLK